MQVRKDFLIGVCAVPELFEATEILQIFSYLVNMVRCKILRKWYYLWRRILLSFSKVDVYFQCRFNSQYRRLDVSWKIGHIFLVGRPLVRRQHVWGLPSNYPVFAVVMVIYHYVERIRRILVTPYFLYNIYSNEKILSRGES